MASPVAPSLTAPLAPCTVLEPVLQFAARSIHDDSSAPLPHPPPLYGGGMGGELFLVKRIAVFARDSRDLREKRDRLEGSSSRVAPVAHVLPVSLTFHAQERRIGDCSRNAHE